MQDIFPYMPLSEISLYILQEKDEKMDKLIEEETKRHEEKVAKYAWNHDMMRLLIKLNPTQHDATGKEIQQLEKSLVVPPKTINVSHKSIHEGETENIYANL